MLKENKNRGAGLVTVVTVLAIASILLAGSIFLAFTHYKNAIQGEIAQQEAAEIKLCAEVIQIAVEKDSKTDIKNLLTSPNGFVNAFYGSFFTEGDGMYRLQNLSVTVEDRPGNSGQLVTIVCGEVSRRYIFDGTTLSEWQEVVS